MKSQISRNRTFATCVGIAVLAAAAMGARQVTSTVGSLAVGPAATGQVRIIEGQPYMVPAGRRLIVQILGIADSPAGPVGASIALEADGLPVLTTQLPFEGGPLELTHGIQFNAGEAVSVRNVFPGDPVIAFGRLIAE